MKKLLAFIAALLVLGCFVYADVSVKDVGGGNAEVTFFYGNPKATEVVIAGTWTDWQNGAQPMTKVEKGWEYKVIVPLATEMKYKFISDGNWTFDMKAPDAVDDGFGGKNGFVDVATLAAASKGAAASADAPKKANIKFITWTMLGAQAKYLTEGGIDKTEKGMDLDNISIGAKSFAKFTGECLPGMPFFVELAIAEKDLGSITLMQKDSTGEYTTKFSDGIKDLGTGLLTNPVAYLSGADDNSGPDKGPGSNPFLGHLKFGVNTKYVNWMTYFNYAKPAIHNPITWTTVAGNWDAGYTHQGGISEFSNGAALQQIGDVKVNFVFAPNKSADRKGTKYGMYSYATATYGDYVVDAQVNGMYDGKYLFETPVEHDVIAGFKGKTAGFEYALQGLAAIHNQDRTSGAQDYFGYSTDVFFREKGFDAQKNTAANVKFGYTGSKLFGADIEYRLRGDQASMLYVRENHDDEEWVLSDQLGVLNSQRVTINGFVKPVETVKLSLNAWAEMQYQDIDNAEIAKIQTAWDWYSHDVYPIMGKDSGAEFEFKPSVNVDLTDMIGMKSSVDFYTTMKYVSYEVAGTAAEYDASDSAFLFENLGIKFSVADLGDVVKSVDVYYGFDNSDSSLLFNTLVGVVKLPMDYTMDLGLGLRSVKGTDAAAAYDEDVLNALGASIGVSKKVARLYKPTVYAQFVYNMDPYKDFGDGQEQLNLDGYVLDGGVSDFNGAAAIRTGIRWDL